MHIHGLQRLSTNNRWDGCGGSLVSPEYVLTAARCIYDRYTVTKYQIGAYCNQTNNCGQPSQTVQVAALYVHQNYRHQLYENDFALVRLARRVNVTTPVGMDQGNVSRDYVPGYRNLYAVGFGALKYNGREPDKLNHVELAYVPQYTCNAKYVGAIFPSMICATDPGQDTCGGDLGGPLYDANVKVQVGIASWGIGCARTDYPGVYSRIADQWPWIQDKICSNHSSPLPDFCGFP